MKATPATPPRLTRSLNGNRIVTRNGVLCVEPSAVQERTMFGHALRCLRPTGPQGSWLCVAGLAIALQFAPTRLSFAATPELEEPWASLASDSFKGRPLADGTGLVSIEMPARAEDAAIVPVTMRVTLPPGDSRRLKTLTFVIDNNPVPVAATFTFGDSAGV